MVTISWVDLSGGFHCIPCIGLIEAERKYLNLVFNGVSVVSIRHFGTFDYIWRTIGHSDWLYSYNVINEEIGF